MICIKNIYNEFDLSPTLASNEMALARRNEGKEVLHMGFGESPFPVPDRLKNSLMQHADCKEYLPTAGLKELRESVSEYYKNRIGLDTSKYDVIIAPGSKLVIYSLQKAIEGDLIMPVPSWVSYKPQAHMIQTNVIKIPAILDKKGYQIDPDSLQQSIKNGRKNGLNPSKLILNYPSNPTGLTIPENNLKEIAEICIQENILIISDEIYGFIAFEDTYRTIARYAPDHTAISTGLSKHLSLGGWRIGIGFIPKTIPNLYKALCTIGSETWSCVPAPIQKAAVSAYQQHDDIESHIADCTVIHSYMNKYIARNLQEIGLHAPEVQGAFYNYPDFDVYRHHLKKAGITTSKELAAYLLEHYGVIALPGSAFGAEPDVLTLRLSGCDYNGTAALKAYRNGEILSKDFIQKNTPRIQMQVDAFKKFIADMTAEP